jgi:hypothetical protein
MKIIMQNKINLMILVFLFFSMGGFAQSAETIAGKWQAENDANRQSEIYLAKDGFYYGKLIAEKGKTENLGKLILKKLKYDSATQTFKGTMSPPDRNMELEATVSFVGKDKLKIVARKFLMSKTVYFVRIK